MKLRIAVYGICKNEEHHIPRWMASAQQADWILLADTGSEDGSIVTAMRQQRQDMPRINVIEIAVNPWRFDMAFNAALAAIPNDMDICIPLGLDEVLEPGWREALEKAWKPHTTKCYITYHQHFPSGETLTFQNDRPHARFGYIWRYPCHEQTYPYMIVPVSSHAPDMVISHHQARRDRSGYMALLETGVKENPHDPRMLHYYGRELYYYKKYVEALPYLLTYKQIRRECDHPVEYANNEKILKECQEVSRALRDATLQQP